MANESIVEVKLTEEDIPGAKLDEPIEKHAIHELKWWLLCHGVRTPSSLKKQQLIDRIREAQKSKLEVVDVDGSYLYRKHQQLLSKGESVAPLSLPDIPLSGWEVVNEQNYTTMAKKIPCVTPGLLYMYLAEGTGKTSGKGAFRALQRGFQHWSCGRLNNLEINTQHPNFCHVRCELTPSMKAGIYHVTMLLTRDGDLAVIESATCECVAGKSASCTHVSGLLHALVSMSESELHIFKRPTAASASLEEEVLPVTSYACKWNVPKKRKVSTLRMSEATFKKHVYGKEIKRCLQPLEEFDPRPIELRGTANERLPELLDKLRGKGLSISLSLDSKTRCWNLEGDKERSDSDALQPELPSKQELQTRVMEFKKCLKQSPEKCREIEFKTREQANSALWYSARRYRLTASYFGAVRQRRPSTPPHSLVLQILGTSTFTSPATEWGKANEKKALQLYEEKQHENGRKDLYACPSGFVISEEYPFLGASPDAAVYDPSVPDPFGLAEIKCPFSVRDVAPTEACSKANFFCTLKIDDTTPQLELKESHPYYAQVQGQMGVTQRRWCDFIVYTEKGLSVQRIHFDPSFWRDLVSKLEEFYDNCLAPEIVSPVHVLGLRVRDLRLM